MVFEVCIHFPEDDKWDNNLMDKLEKRFYKLKKFNATVETSSDNEVEKNITLDKLRLKKDTIETFCKSNI